MSKLLKNKEVRRTLFWQVVVSVIAGAVPIVIENSLSDKDLITWKRIKAEPYSLLEKE